MKKAFLSLLIGVLLALGTAVVLPKAEAHSGGTDKYGCHTCKTNCPKWGLKKGQYHCHKSKGLAQPKPSIKSKKLK